MEVLKELSSKDPMFLLKLIVMVKMRALPTESRVKKLSNIQWVLLYKVIDELEKRQNELWLRVLGLKIKDTLIPLSMFVNPDAVKAIYEKMEQGEGLDESLMTAQEDMRLREVFETDIDSLLSEEEKKKIVESELDYIKRKDEILGIKVREDA